MSASLVKRQPERSKGRPGLGGDLAGAGPGRARGGDEGRVRRLRWPGRGKTGGDVEEQERDPSPVESWTGAGRWSSRAATGAIIAAMACGPVALGLSLTGGDPAPATVAAGEDPTVAARRGAAQEVAQEWVSVWLTSRPQDPRVAAYWSGQVQLPDRPARVANVRVVSAVAAAPGAWTVVVGADVTEVGRPMVRRYYQVPVGVQGDEAAAGAQVLAVPAEVPGPGTASEAQMNYPTTLPVEGPVGSTVGPFVGALVAGKGELRPWLTPGSRVQPVPNAGYTDVQITSLSASADVPGAASGAPADGAQVHVLVTAEGLSEAAKSAPGAVKTPTPDASNGVAGVGSAASSGRSLQYQLLLTARGGRWEVTSIESTPQVKTGN